MQLTRRSAVRLLTANTLLPAIESHPAASFVFGDSALAQRGAYKDPSLPVEHRVQDLLARMIVEEKARQLDMYAALFDSVQPLPVRDAGRSAWLLLCNLHPMFSLFHKVEPRRRTPKTACERCEIYDPGYQPCSPDGLRQ